ncbi:hypothetical protein [Microbacterium arborescens]|uniref:hypothetical protein n=1 Tax=Microbacterium arborescens TaxID=33883 RepID=UPI00277F5FAA|nr:hypothetical protein [Microbacterium arborescens]MDQ1215726.1 hypothetical protein [Microbacterium arborescens]
MSAPVSAPDPFTTRAHAADWLELMALSAWPRAYRSTEYVSSLNLALDKPDGADRHPGEDEEILDNEYDDLLELVTDEIRWRAEVLGSSYPFALKVGTRSWSLSFRRDGDAPTRAAQDVYTACLLISAIRHGKLEGLPAKARGVNKIADAFQAVVYLIAPALLGGTSFWIAFPRPEHDDYGPAIDRLLAELGVGEATSSRPPTQRSNKDGGVDIVSWRSFPDRRSNIMLSYGQVATGKGWREKSVKNKLEGYFHRWLAVRPVFHYLPAMYIPHVMHESIEATRGSTFEQMASEDAHTLEASLGVVIDRIRMTVLAGDAYSLREVGSERGSAHLTTLRRWHHGLVKNLRDRT